MFQIFWFFPFFPLVNIILFYGIFYGPMKKIVKIIKKNRKKSIVNIKSYLSDINKVGKFTLQKYLELPPHKGDNGRRMVKETPKLISNCRNSGWKEYLCKLQDGLCERRTAAGRGTPEWMNECLNDWMNIEWLTNFFAVIHSNLMNNFHLNGILLWNEKTPRGRTNSR